MRCGVPPRMYPTLKSWSSSPATDDDTQTTAATPSTAATPDFPETPSETISKAAINNVESVIPETGLLEDPIIPQRLPETVAKKNPTSSMTTAARMAGRNNPETWTYRKHMRTNMTAIKAKTVLKLM